MLYPCAVSGPFVITQLFSSSCNMASLVLSPAESGKFVSEHSKHVSISEQGVKNTARKVGVRKLFLIYITLVSRIILISLRD